MMTRFSEMVQDWLGWCPMAAAAQRKTEGQKTAVSQEKATEAGPVTGREILFSRLTWAVVGLSWIIALAALPYLPEVMPVHWSLFGEADGFTGRLPGAFGLPVIITLTVVLLRVLPRFEQMKEGLGAAKDIYQILLFSSVTLLLVIEMVTLLSSAGTDVPLAVIIPILLGVFFIVMGGLMPSLPRNTTIGFRLPWTIRDEMVWKRTHEHGGPLLVLAGAVIVLGSPFAGTWALSLMLVIFLAVSLYLTIWSYRLAKAGATGVVE
ncbi:MAG: SdpI family protein [Methanoregula sp.]|jgi:uncharacterized membrane protein